MTELKNQKIETVDDKNVQDSEEDIDEPVNENGKEDDINDSQDDKEEYADFTEFQT